MMTIEPMHTADFNDTALVAETLAGNHEAFRQIVERYQTLITSLAYCATGNVGQSEDLAQETFVSAWKQMAELREPAKLRPWLCSITRFLISKKFRRQGREPVHAAESLEAVDEWVAPELPPSDQAITEEEKAILWRSLERIPEIYREPLVLFYREQQSIESVARDLGLSEDAVKQRLARGRKLLQEQFLAFVAGALKQTTSGRTFTLGVLAALPLLATTTKAATATAAASKGGTVAKATTGAGTLGGFPSTGLVLFFSLFGVFGFFGRFLGRKMGRTGQQSPLGRKRIVQFWRTLAIGFFVFVLPPLRIPNSMLHTHPWLFRAETWSLTAFYILVAAALVLWICRRKRDIRHGDAEAPQTPPTTSRSYNVWLCLGMAGPAWVVGVFLFGICFSNWPLAVKRISDAEARSLVSERRDAQYTVYQYRNGSKSLAIVLPEERRRVRETDMDDALLSTLTEKGIAFRTMVEDEDFHNGGVQGWLVMLCTFILVAGIVLLRRRPGTCQFYQQEIRAARAEHWEVNILAVGAALILFALGLLVLAFLLGHGAPTISRAAADKFITAQTPAKFELLQYDNGAKELWITPPGSRIYPGYIAPANESTLALLTANNVSYKTMVQGRDFGYSAPNRWWLVLLCLVLVAGGMTILWWVVRTKRLLAVPAVASR